MMANGDLRRGETEGSGRGQRQRLPDPVAIAFMAATLGLLTAALADIRRRPASQIRGSKRMWVALSLINWLLGPLAYFIIGRRRS